MSEDSPFRTEEMTLDQMLIQYAARIRKAAKGDNPIRDAGIAREQVRMAIESNYIPKAEALNEMAALQAQIDAPPSN